MCVCVSVEAVLAPFFPLCFGVVALDVVAAAARPRGHARDVVVPVGHPKQGMLGQRREGHDLLWAQQRGLGPEVRLGADAYYGTRGRKGVLGARRGHGGGVCSPVGHRWARGQGRLGQLPAPVAGRARA